MNAFTFQIILWIDITEHDKMKREFIHITDNNKHRLMSDSGFLHGSTNKNSRDKMKKILSMAVLNEQKGKGDCKRAGSQLVNGFPSHYEGKG